MNPYRKDPSVQFPTGHELIYGRTASGKSEALRKHISEEITAEGLDTWVVDPHMALPELAGLANKYAVSSDEVRRLMADLIAELHYRAEKLADLGVTVFDVADPRHGLPLIVVTVEEAATVLQDPWSRAVVERAVQDGWKTGVVVRLVVSIKDRPNLALFGGSEVIRSAVVNANEHASEKASA